MNEILAIIYFCFATDLNEEFKLEAESEAFFCFTLLMGDIQDGFIGSFDSSNFGLNSKVKQLDSLLNLADPAIWKHLNDLGISPEFYSIRWILLMLTQEFELGDVLILWDSLFAMGKDKNLFLLYLCLAMLILNREKFLEMGFSDLMENLQKLEITEVFNILSLGYELYLTYSGKAPIPTFV